MAGKAWARFRDHLKENAKYWLVVAVLVLVVAVLVGAWHVFRPQYPLTLREFEVASVLKLLMSFFVVALFIERAAEVFAVTVRGPEEAVKKSDVSSARSKLAGIRDDDRRNVAVASLSAAEDRLSDVSREASRYGAETARCAALVTFGLGVAAGIIGFRLLLPLVEPASLAGLTVPQRMAFHGLDAVVTGAIIGGGADGIHKLMQAIIKTVEFVKVHMESKAEEARNGRK